MLEIGGIWREDTGASTAGGMHCTAGDSAFGTMIIVPEDAEE